MIASLQALLSKAISLEIFQSLRSLLTDSSHVSLGLRLLLFTLSTRSRTPLRTGASGGLRWTCHRQLVNFVLVYICISTLFSVIGGLFIIAGLYLVTWARYNEAQRVLTASYLRPLLVEDLPTSKAEGGSFSGSIDP